MEQQLRKQYAITNVGMNGVVIRPGTVLVVQEDGLKSVPASYQGYYANSMKKGGKITHNIIQRIGTGRYLEEARLLDVGEKAYVTNIDFKDTEVVFSVQSCGACDPSAVDPGNPPFRASLAFQFPKGFLSAAGLGASRRRRSGIRNCARGDRKSA